MTTAPFQRTKLPTDIYSVSYDDSLEGIDVHEYERLENKIRSAIRSSDGFFVSANETYEVIDGQYRGQRVKVLSSLSLYVAKSRVLKAKVCVAGSCKTVLIEPKYLKYVSPVSSSSSLQKRKRDNAVRILGPYDATKREEMKGLGLVYVHQQAEHPWYQNKTSADGEISYLRDEMMPSGVEWAGAGYYKKKPVG